MADESHSLSTAERNELGNESFAFTEQRKLPLTDAEHVRNAIARFNQVEGVDDDDRDRAWARIKSAADRHGVEVSEKSWHELNV
jgi:Family of unknown function (DUF6582)